MRRSSSTVWTQSIMDQEVHSNQQNSAKDMTPHIDGTCVNVQFHDHPGATARAIMSKVQQLVTVTQDAQVNLVHDSEFRGSDSLYVHDERDLLWSRSQLEPMLRVVHGFSSSECKLRRTCCVDRVWSFLAGQQLGLNACLIIIIGQKVIAICLAHATKILQHSSVQVESRLVAVRQVPSM